MMTFSPKKDDDLSAREGKPEKKNQKIRATEINEIGQEAGGSDFCWSMDNLFPVFVYIGTIHILCNHF